VQMDPTSALFLTLLNGHWREGLMVLAFVALSVFVAGRVSRRRALRTSRRTRVE
jgi:hypothetical protein